MVFQPKPRYRLLAQTPQATAEVLPFGSSLSTPAAIDEVVIAGPLTLRISEVVLGAEATERVMAVSTRNAAPMEGFSYAVALVSIENTGPRPMFIDNDDFGFITSARRVWSRLQIVPPEPAMDGALEPGELVEGWVAGLVEDDDENILLQFNSRALGGSWTERFFALGPGSRLGDPEGLPGGPNDAGASIETPAQIGEAVITGDWSLTITDVAFAEDVVALYPPEDYRATALASAAPDVVPFWIAFHIEIQLIRSDRQLHHFPVDALGLSQEDGAPVPDVRVVTAPLPDISGAYVPGGRGAGWFVLELPPGFSGTVLRFQPFRTDSDVRYVSWSEATSAVRSPYG